MWTFQYKHGDRPLEGYTIQRAAGRGGFGEVYYAVSDSGREVALKVISGYEQIELRGISQCMNLKSPHLVTIFDVRQNAEGRWFVIMEFVSGPNLRQLMDESPAGLGTQKTAFFLREIAKGLTFLHECGIVHRDLKPANIFYENGYVKIGDYGLSKAISPDQHSGQTVTVGTVHYMAPEIGAGKYDRSVDIYALGALVYEMLTGTVPHVGASPTEVLLKHLSAEPDYTNVPEPFNRVIRKAMAKDPAQRYQSVQEMVEDVFGAEHIRQSVSVFSPQDLSMIAEHAAKRISTGGGSGGGVGVATGSSAATRETPGAKPPAGFRFANNMFDQVFRNPFGGFNNPWGTEADPSSDTNPAAVPPPPLPDSDPLSSGQRRTLAALLSIAAAVVGTALGENYVGGAGAIFFIFPCTWGLSYGTLLAARRVLPAMEHESKMVRRLVLGLFAGGLSFVFTLPFFALFGVRTFSPSGRHLYLGQTYLMALLAMVAACIILPIDRIIRSDRKSRINLGYAVAAGFIAFIAAQMLADRDEVGYLAATCASAAIVMLQMLASWSPAKALANKSRFDSIKDATARHSWAARVGRFGEQAGRFGEQAGRIGEKAGRVGAQAGQAVATVANEIFGTQGPSTAPQVPPMPGTAPSAAAAQKSSTQYWYRPTWPAVRWAWGLLMVLTFAASIAFWVAAGCSRNDSDLGTFTTLGFAAFFFSVLSVVRACTKRFYGWWGYLIKPLLIVACATGCVAMFAVMGTSAHLNGTEWAFTWFFLMMFFGAGIVLLCIPGRYRLTTAPPPIPGTDPSSAPATNLDWQGTPPIEAARAHYGGTLLGLISGIFLQAMLGVGLLYAFNLPRLLASDLLDPSLSYHLRHDVFGSEQWPKPMENLLAAIMFVLMLVSMSFLTFARRSRGGIHILRGVLAVLVFSSAIGMLHGSFNQDTWNNLAALGNVPPGQIIMGVLNGMSLGLAGFSTIVFMFGVMLIAWPPSEQKDPKKKASGLAILAWLVVGGIVVAFLLPIVASVGYRQVEYQPAKTETPNHSVQPVNPFTGQKFPDQKQFHFGGGGSRVTMPTLPPKPPAPSRKNPPTTRNTPTTVPDGVFEDQ